MGRLEKIVVFTVLFLVAAILFVSLRSDSSGQPELANAGERVAARNGKRAGARPDGAAVGDSSENTSARPPRESVPGGTMSTSLAPRVVPEGASGAPLDAANDGVNVPADGDRVAADGVRAPTTQDGAAPQVPGAPVALQGQSTPAQPAPRAETQFLVSRAGLTATASDEFMLYTWQVGDSYRSLAEKYYGSPAHAKRLRDANEGRDDAKLAAGDTILVCVKPTAAADRIARPSARDAQAPSGIDGGTYTVGAGDVLGTISKHVYGSASKWRKIYDANRDVIGADPNQLKVGMVLRIPQ